MIRMTTWPPPGMAMAIIPIDVISGYSSKSIIIFRYKFPLCQDVDFALFFTCHINCSFVALFIQLHRVHAGSCHYKHQMHQRH